ncbi:MAG: thiamine pyrophosphate-binding protein [Candidatus Puniceispirillales bacterium]
MKKHSHGGEIITRCLEEQGVERLFCVPGESFLPVLDGLQQSSIETVLARHEGGAAMMAEAEGKMTGRPGVAMVTRGPGATNASSGIHIAQQDSTPLIVLIGQVARGMKGRDAFQEVDYQALFGGMAKHVAEVDDVSTLAETITRGFEIAMSGRPGPVVISLPEDMLYDETVLTIPARVTPAFPAPDTKTMAEVADRLKAAAAPIIIAGGPLWDAAAIAMLAEAAERFDVPVACSFRRQRLMNSLHPRYAGDLGLGCNPKLLARIKESDLVVMVGGRLSEIPSQSYSLLDIPQPQMPLIHIHSDAAELGRVYTPTIGIETTPGQFLAALLESAPAARQPLTACPEHEAYRDWVDTVPDIPGAMNMAAVVHHLRDVLPPESIMTNGAGNYATWLHRFYHFRDPLCQLAPTSGSMGYGIPAAVAAKARFPERPVIAFAGDGCFQMTMQELATARQIGANIIVLVIDNGMYGTIRMHQEREFPGRNDHTGLINPDFVGIGKAMGFHAEKVEKTEAFAAAFDRCLNGGKPALLHLPIDPEAISPTTTLTRIRQAALSS